MRIAFLILLPLLGAPAVWQMGRSNGRLRDGTVIACTVLSMGLSLSLLCTAAQGDAATFFIPHMIVNGLSFTATGFRALYSVVTSFMWLLTTLFSMEYFSHERGSLNAYWMFTLMTLGATQGVMLSADFMTTFIFFEILSLTSFTWVMHEQTPDAIHAGYTYLFIAIFGGLVLLMGLFLLYGTCGTLEYAALPAAVRDADSVRVFAASVCILFGFGAKAGMFPLHVWLPMAHPVAPSPASALLSGVLTKVGVYGILMTVLEVMGGNQAFGFFMLSLALVTMLLGAVLALCSENLKRTLACSSMSQIGFILTGLASETLTPGGNALALSGTVLHMLNHSMLKLLLFMAAGVVLMNLHTIALDDIRGWGRSHPFLKVTFAVGALGISGVPLFNGYLSKSMLHEGLLHAMGAVPRDAFALSYFHAAEWVFLCSGGLTFAYMLKLFLCVFVERNSDSTVQARYDKSTPCVNRLSAVALALPALTVAALGQPWIAAHVGAFACPAPEFAAFSWENLRGALISLTIGAAVYMLIVRRGKARWPSEWNLERRLYTPLLTRWFPSVCGHVVRLFAENAVLRPVCRCTVLTAATLARALSDSTDALIVLLRRTVIREVKVRDEQSAVHIGRVRAFRRATTTALDAVHFSFALLMTCLGIILILGVLLILL